MSRRRNLRAVKLAMWIVAVAVIAIYAGSFLLGVTASVSLTFLGVLEFIGSVSIPVAGGAVLLWFAYKFFLEPVIRQRRLDRIREYRARREANLTIDSTDRTDFHG